MLQKLNDKISKCCLRAGPGVLPYRFIACGSFVKVYLNDLIHIIEVGSEVITFEIHESTKTLVAFTHSSISVFDLFDYDLVVDYKFKQRLIVGFTRADDFLVVDDERNLLVLPRNSRKNAAGLNELQEIGVKLVFKSQLLPNLTRLIGDTIFFCCAKKMLRLDLVSKKFTTEKIQQGNFTSMDANEKFVAVGDEKGKIYIYDQVTLKQVQTIHWHHKAVTAISISGSVVTSGGHENTLLIFNLDTQVKSFLPRLIPSATQANKEIATLFPIKQILRMDDFIGVAYESKLIVIESSSNTKQRQEINLVRYFEHSRIQTHHESPLISDGHNLDVYSPTHNLITSLQQTHTLFTTLSNGVCLYKDRVCHFYEFASGNKLQLLTSMHVQYEVLQMISTPDALITVNSNNTVSLCKKIKIPPRNHVNQPENVGPRITWKVVMVNEYKNKEIKFALVEDDVLIIAYEDELSFWHRQTFEYLFSRKYNNPIKKVCLNGKHLLVCFEGSLVLENMMDLEVCWNVPIEFGILSLLPHGDDSFVCVTDEANAKLLKMNSTDIRSIYSINGRISEIVGGGDAYYYAIKGSLFKMDAVKVKKYAKSTVEDGEVGQKVVDATAKRVAGVHSLFDVEKAMVPQDYSLRVAQVRAPVTQLFEKPCHMVDMESLYNAFMKTTLRPAQFASQ